jgi:large subunit ribosomal protein L25
VREGGVLDQTLREVVVRALPDALPDSLELDVSELDVGDSIAVDRLSAPEGVEIVADPEIVVASVLAPTVEVEEEPEELEEGEEAAEAAEGEEAPAAEPEGEAPEE